MKGTLVFLSNAESLHFAGRVAQQSRVRTKNQIKFPSTIGWTSESRCFAILNCPLSVKIRSWTQKVTSCNIRETWKWLKLFMVAVGVCIRCRLQRNSSGEKHYLYEALGKRINVIKKRLWKVCSFYFFESLKLQHISMRMNEFFVFWNQPIL